MTQIGKGRCTQFLQIITLQVPENTILNEFVNIRMISGVDEWNYSLTRFAKFENNSDGK